MGRLRLTGSYEVTVAGLRCTTPVAAPARTTVPEKGTTTSHTASQTRPRPPPHNILTDTPILTVIREDTKRHQSALRAGRAGLGREAPHLWALPRGGPTLQRGWIALHAFPRTGVVGSRCARRGCTVCVGLGIACARLRKFGLGPEVAVEAFGCFVQ
jgi:hypothetical protein